jgi:hypothetical protein
LRADLAGALAGARRLRDSLSEVEHEVARLQLERDRYQAAVLSLVDTTAGEIARLRAQERELRRALALVNDDLLDVRARLAAVRNR